VSPPCFGSPAAGRFGPFAASLKHHIDGAFVLANAHLPDSQTSVSSFSAAVSPFNAHSSRSVRGGLVQHVFSLPSRWLSPCPSRYRPVCRAAKLKTLCVMQHLDLTDEEAAALTKELADITGNDRYPFSPRIQTLRAILAKLKPEPAREPLPPPKHYEPPKAKRRG
jgi:hypothetical protein